jgi:hypothetical protein
MGGYRKHRKIYRRVSNDVVVEFGSFYPKLSTPIIDEIDGLLAEHYGSTPEGLDFIVNYAIKYRMGAESEDEGEE